MELLVTNKAVRRITKQTMFKMKFKLQDFNVNLNIQLITMD